MFKTGLLILCLLLPLSACKEKQGAVLAPASVHELVILTHNGDVHRFNVELALTPQDQAKGLMHRTSLAEDAGMLFYFDMPREQSFWMKNTLISLDLIFITQEGVIHHIHKNAIPKDETPLPSKGVVVSVLEINGGLSDKLKIKAGDKVKHSFFK